MDEVGVFFGQFPNPWALRMSGMGGYTSKCEKKPKSLHPSVQGFIGIGGGLMCIAERTFQSLSLIYDQK
jgi:hypothetical protein